MDRVCATTVVSADHFQYYVPMFVYTVKIAYPDWHVLVFVKGLLNNDAQNFLLKMRDEKWCDPGWEIKQDVFGDYANLASTCNALRILVPDRDLDKFDYVYFADADFLVFPHRVPHLDYYKSVMRKSKTCHAAMRGALKHFKRPNITKKGWIGKYARIAMGCLMVRHDWLDKTKKSRNGYRKRLAVGKHDKYDVHRPASYREFDEVMVGRIFRDSALRVPAVPRTFVNGQEFNIEYRNIHLGDFKNWDRWKRHDKMGKLMSGHAAKSYYRLIADPRWREIAEFCRRSPMVKQCLNNLKHYLDERARMK